jgi:hypothetical protein
MVGVTMPAGLDSKNSDDEFIGRSCKKLSAFKIKF